MDRELELLGLTHKDLERAVKNRKVPKRSVDLSRLVSPQTRVRREGVALVVEGKRTWDVRGLPTVLLTPSGHLVVNDGNHRLSADILQGKTTAVVRLVDLKSLASKSRQW